MFGFKSVPKLKVRDISSFNPCEEKSANGVKLYLEENIVIRKGFVDCGSVTSWLTSTHPILSPNFA